MPSFKTTLALLATAGVLVSFSPALAAPPAVQPYAWRGAEVLGGGFVSGVVYHPTEKGLVYARTDIGGAYRLDRQAGAWVALNDGLTRADNQLSGALSLAVDPQDSNRLYMAAGEYTGPNARGGALLRSTDRGATWAKAELPVKIGGNEDGRNTGERLMVDPHQGAVLLLGAKDGLYRSADHGATWSRVESFPRLHVTVLAFDPVETVKTGETAIVYAGVAGAKGGGLLVSTDAGATWGAIGDQPKGLIPHHLALDAKGGVYVTYGNGLGPNGVTDGAVWRLDPNSGAWTDITPVKPSGTDVFGYGGLSLDPSRPGVVMVSTLDRWVVGDEVFRSTDGGKSWKPLRDKAHHDVGRAAWVRRLEGKAGREMGHWIGDFDIDPTNPDEAIYVTGYGLWRTRNLTEADRSGRTDWRFDDEGIEETVPLELVSPPDSASGHAPLISTIGDIGGFRHDDLTTVANSRYFDPHGGTNRGLDFAELAPEVMVRTSDPTPTGGFRSTDGGKTWTAFASSPPREASKETGRIALSADGRRMVWAMRKAAPYVSSDQGQTWRPVQGVTAGDQPNFIPASDRVNPSRFYLYDAAQGAVLASTDGGETFRTVARDLPGAGPLKAVPGVEAEVWLPTRQGLMRSTHGGAAFKRIAGVDDAGLVGFGKAAPGQTHPAVFIWGKVEGVEGVFRSDDVGKTWLKLNDDRWGFAELRALTGDPARFGRVYLGVHGRGIVYGDPAPAKE
ncbi:BNR/Asp-box repeat protein [Caulobacter sp. AP07]|uniref:BNR/Asp-box repeat protein n=1 Tax=Caulobacter sp. AP07 TaxID=1144304 RepID=UPI00027201B0|nr:BNR/Asp-box repeat protein [Caulobacter sp. AP07]EJL30336.1 BNR/Asp-box repeat protein [Caulobacter sp. AP07]